MKVFIIEDEYLSLERLRKLLGEARPTPEILGHAESIKSAVQWLANNAAPDLIFMDIELADGQCFDIFSQVEVRAPIIFTTSYDEYALRAFKVNSIDYLLKPVNREALAGALDKYRRLQEQLHPAAGLPTQFADGLGKLLEELGRFQQPQEYRRRFLLKQGPRWIAVEVHEIAWFRAESKLCYLKTWDNRRFVVDYPLEEVAQMLDPAEFFRVSRSYFVHAKAVRSIDADFGGKLRLQLQPKTEADDVLVSKEKAKEFKQWMGR